MRLFAAAFSTSLLLTLLILVRAAPVPESTGRATLTITSYITLQPAQSLSFVALPPSNTIITTRSPRFMDLAPAPISPTAASSVPTTMMDLVPAPVTSTAVPTASVETTTITMPPSTITLQPTTTTLLQSTLKNTLTAPLTYGQLVFPVDGYRGTVVIHMVAAQTSAVGAPIYGPGGEVVGFIPGDA